MADNGSRTTTWCEIDPETGRPVQNPSPHVKTMKTPMSEGVVYVQALQKSKESADRSTATYVTLSSTPHIAATNDVDHIAPRSVDFAAMDRWLNFLQAQRGV